MRSGQPASTQRGILWTSVVMVAGLGGLSQAVLVAAESIPETKTRLSAWVETLASDAMEGRGIGTKGLDLAAEFVTQEFKKAGLDITQVNGGPFQTFDMITGAKLAEGNTLKLMGPEGKTIELTLGTDYEVCSFGGSASFEGELVFAGYGIDDKNVGYSDFSDLDVAGKVLVIMRKNPQQANPKGLFGEGQRGRTADLRSKMSEATTRKAAAVVFVNDPYSIKQKAESRATAIHKQQAEVATLAAALLKAEDEKSETATASRAALSTALKKWTTLKDDEAKAKNDELMPFGYAGNGNDKPVPPAVHLSQAKLDEILQATLKKTLKDLEAEIDADRKPRTAVLTGWKAVGTTAIERVRSNVANVIGVIEGEGPLAEETLVVGAHYDHVGFGGPNSLAPGAKEVHNGADDNASGTVALLELARRFGAKGKKPPRRLVFMAFTAEEVGLIGSERYVNHPVWPLDKTIAMFNLDMVGRLNENKLIVYGTGTSSRWSEELNALNAMTKFEFSFKPEGFGPSDHSSFYGKKIPVLHLFTGTHPDYHKPSDDVDKLNIEGIARVCDLLEGMIVKTLDNPQRPDYIEIKQMANPTRGGSRPYFGVIPDFGGEGNGMAITGASGGSPADKAGLKAGDRITSIGGNKIVGLDDFDLALRKFKAGDEIVVIVQRAGQEISLKVTLEPPR